MCAEGLREPPLLTLSFGKWGGLVFFLNLCVCFHYTFAHTARQTKQAAVSWVPRTPDSTVLTTQETPGHSLPLPTPHEGLHGATRLEPACLASWAEIRSPVRIISMTSDFPTARVSLWVPPAPVRAEGCWSQLGLWSIQTKMPDTLLASSGAEGAPLRWGGAGTRSPASGPLVQSQTLDKCTQLAAPSIRLRPIPQGLSVLLYPCLLAPCWGLGPQRSPPAS